MTNAVIGYRNRFDEALTLSGGSWTTPLPLANLRRRTLGRVARSTSAAVADTTFSFAGSTSYSAQMIAICGHSLSPAATGRFRASNEDTVTNQGLKTEKLDDAAWTLTAATVTANATAAPDGATTADFVNETATTNTHNAKSNNVTKSGVSQLWTASIMVKPNGRNFVNLRFAKNLLGGSYKEYVFDLVAGTATAGSSSGSEFTGVTAGIVTGLPGGFSRIWVSGTWGSGVTSIYARLGLMFDATTDNYLGVVGSGVYAWGLQIEQGALSSYYPSDGTAGVRPAGYVDAWQTYSYDSGYLPAYDAGVTTDQLTGYTKTFAVYLGAPVTVKGWRVDLSDASNPDGYVQVGRVFVGPAWSPRVNMDTGAGIGWEDNSTSQEALSNAEYFNVKTPYRVIRFNTPRMTETEAFASGFDIQRRSGVTGEVVFMWAGDDTTHRLERTFYGRLRQLSAIEYWNVDVYRQGWEIKELI